MLTAIPSSIVAARPSLLVISFHPYGGGRAIKIDLCLSPGEGGRASVRKKRENSGCVFALTGRFSRYHRRRLFSFPLFRPAPSLPPSLLFFFVPLSRHALRSRPFHGGRDGRTEGGFMMSTQTATTTSTSGCSFF